MPPKHAPKQDLYEVLEVPRDADAAAIKAAWRRLAGVHHPDTFAAHPVETEPTEETDSEAKSVDADASCGSEACTTTIGTQPARGTIAGDSDARTEEPAEEIAATSHLNRDTAPMSQPRRSYERFLQIQLAYKILGDKTKRETYDRSLLRHEPLAEDGFPGEYFDEGHDVDQDTVSLHRHGDSAFARGDTEALPGASDVWTSWQALLRVWHAGPWKELLRVRSLFVIVLLLAVATSIHVFRLRRIAHEGNAGPTALALVADKNESGHGTNPQAETASRPVRGLPQAQRTAISGSSDAQQRRGRNPTIDDITRSELPSLPSAQTLPGPSRSSDGQRGIANRRGADSYAGRATFVQPENVQLVAHDIATSSAAPLDALAASQRAESARIRGADAPAAGDKTTLPKGANSETSPSTTREPEAADRPIDLSQHPQMNKVWIAGCIDGHSVYIGIFDGRQKPAALRWQNWQSPKAAQSFVFPYVFARQSGGNEQLRLGHADGAVDATIDLRGSSAQLHLTPQNPSSIPCRSWRLHRPDADDNLAGHWLLPDTAQSGLDQALPTKHFELRITRSKDGLVGQASALYDVGSSTIQPTIAFTFREDPTRPLGSFSWTSASHGQGRLQLVPLSTNQLGVRWEVEDLKPGNPQLMSGEAILRKR